MLNYAARNAILPNLTGFAMSLGFVVGGAILIEYVFNYPGVGYMLLQAVENEDYPLMQALFLLITVAVLVAILLADIATAIFDPRTRRREPAATTVTGPARARPELRSPGGSAAPSGPTARPRPARPAAVFICSRCSPACSRGDNPTAEAYPRNLGPSARTCSAPPASARTCSPRRSTAPGRC